MSWAALPTSMRCAQSGCVQSSGSSATFSLLVLAQNKRHVSISMNFSSTVAKVGIDKLSTDIRRPNRTTTVATLVCNG